MPSIDCKTLKEQVMLHLSALPCPNEFLAGIVTKEDEVGQSYQRIKQRAAGLLGVDYRIYLMSQDRHTGDVTALIRQITTDKHCGGIVVQLPLPSGIDTNEVINSIPPRFDVDCLSAKPHQRGDESAPQLLPPAVQTTQNILEHLNINPAEKEVCIIGSGLLVGQPIAAHFASLGVPNLSILQKGDNLESVQDASLLILGAGVPGLIRAETLKKGAVVIDFGYGKDAQGILRGDFATNEARADIYYTPTPGGTGPLLIANLLKNFYLLNKSQQ